MEQAMITFPFEVSFEHIQAAPDTYVQAVFSCLESEFLVLPKGYGFIEYPVFETGYEALKQATTAFTTLTPATLYSVVLDVPISLIVLRTMLGFTPSEWAYIATQHTGVEASQGFVRTFGPPDSSSTVQTARHRPSHNGTRPSAVYNSLSAFV